MIKPMKFSQFLDYINGISGQKPCDMTFDEWAFEVFQESYPEIAERIKRHTFDPGSMRKEFGYGMFVKNDMRDFLVCLLQSYVEMD